MTELAPFRSLLDDQIRYYRARAAEYDQWFFRQGRWDRGEDLNQRWFSEVEQVRAALHTFNPGGSVLEIACGTGLWTEQLAPYAAEITALDTSAEMIEISRQRVRSSKVRYLQGDVFEWQPEARYEAVFFAFWLSHVPPELFTAFWEMVKNVLKPDGRVFFVDSAYNPTSTAKDHQLAGTQDTMIDRRLNDGSVYRIVKVFYQPENLARRLAGLGWRFQIDQTPSYFIYGSGSRAAHTAGAPACVPGRLCCS